MISFTARYKAQTVRELCEADEAYAMLDMQLFDMMDDPRVPPIRDLLFQITELTGKLFDQVLATPVTEEEPTP